MAVKVVRSIFVLTPSSAIRDMPCNLILAMRIWSCGSDMTNKMPNLGYMELINYVELIRVSILIP